MLLLFLGKFVMISLPIIIGIPIAFVLECISKEKYEWYLFVKRTTFSFSNPSNIKYNNKKQILITEKQILIV